MTKNISNRQNQEHGSILHNEIHAEAQSLEQFIQKYKQLLLDCVSGISDTTAEEVLDTLYEKVSITKTSLIDAVDAIDEELGEHIVNTIKKGGTGEVHLLIKPKTLMQGANPTKFYFNSESLENFSGSNRNLEDMLQNTHDTYRNYALSKIAEFIQDPSSNIGFTSEKKFLQGISGNIEFPYSFVQTLIQYLVKYNIIELGKKYKIKLSKKGEVLFPIINELFFSDGKIDLEQNQNLANYIIELFQESPNDGYKAINTKIQKAIGFKTGGEDIKIIQETYLKMLTQGDGESLSQLNLRVVKQKKKYNIEGNDYVFYYKDKNLKGGVETKSLRLSIDAIDQVFFLYSSNGADLTQKEVMEVVGLEGHVWNILKGRLNLVKLSGIAGPYTLESFRGSEEKISEYTRIQFKNYDARRLEKVTKEQFRRELSKQRAKVEQIVGGIENFKRYMGEVLEKYKPKDLDMQYEQTETPNNDEITVSFSDIHLGKVGTDSIIQRLGKIISHIQKRPETGVNILCLGDLAEALVEGAMHNGQKEKMDWAGKDVYESMMEITNILEHFLVEIYKSGKKVSFKGIGGNHDRIGKNHDQDMSRTGALVIYELVKRGLLRYDEISVNYFVEKWNAFDMQKFRYIIHHGDDGASNKVDSKAGDVLWELGSQEKPNIILVGDKHNLNMKNPFRNSFKIQVPALAGAGEYDSRLLLSSNPGYVTIQSDEDDMPLIETRIFSETGKKERIGWKNENPFT